MINICCPVLRRYDLLRDMVQSTRSSNVRPDTYYIIDNGQNKQAVLQALGDFEIDVKLHTPKKPLGIAESWNWFIDRVPEERLIVNDDVTFGPDSIGQMIKSKADMVWATGSGFACFLLRDACVQKIGRFDETISPGYGYYEDEDYLQRLDGRGTRTPSAVAEEVACGVMHHRSATLQAADHKQRLEHHKRFLIAQKNYAKKWNIEKDFGLPVTVRETAAVG